MMPQIQAIMEQRQWSAPPAGTQQQGQQQQGQQPLQSTWSRFGMDAPTQAMPQPVSYVPTNPTQIRDRLLQAGATQEEIAMATSTAEARKTLLPDLMKAYLQPKAEGGNLYRGLNPISRLSDSGQTTYGPNGPTLRPTAGYAENQYVLDAGKAAAGLQFANPTIHPNTGQVIFPGLAARQQGLLGLGYPTQLRQGAAQGQGTQPQAGTRQNGPVFPSGSTRGGNVTTEPSDVVTKGFQASNDDFIKNSYRPTLDAAKLAQEGLFGIDALEKLPLNAKTGWGTEAQAYAARVLTSLGVPSQDIKNIASDAAVFESVKNARLLAIQQAQKGPQTEADAARINATQVALANTPQANQFINDMGRSLLNMQKKKAEFFADNLESGMRSGNAASIEAAWNKKAPSLWADPAMKKWEKYGETGKADVPTSGKKWVVGKDGKIKEQ
jgi:hypothetical protein